ncbi:hypothetical protein B0H12DRAFT_1149072 [Mycena haematopus]|nr:hypothetical protein B0H12DRAFT_1149072 [Mycena haematopus]
MRYRAQATTDEQDVLFGQLNRAAKSDPIQFLWEDWFWNPCNMAASARGSLRFVLWPTTCTGDCDMDEIETVLWAIQCRRNTLEHIEESLARKRIVCTARTSGTAVGRYNQ